MAVCRVEKNKNYTTMSNFHLRDRNLSNKARGLLSTMLSLPEDWDYTTRGLALICKDGVDSITAQLKELEQYGYLSRRRLRDENGRITDMEYVIYEEPHTVSPDTALPDTASPDTASPDTASPYTENPDMVNPDMENPRPGNPAQRNIDIRNTERQNTDRPSTDSFLPSREGAEVKRKDAMLEKMRDYREIVMDAIGYDDLLRDIPQDRDRVDEMLELIVETVCTSKSFIRVAGADYPAEVVRSRLLKLDGDHIRFVLDCMRENTTKVRNIKQYLLTALYNAPATIGNYYTSRVQHDFCWDSPHG